MTEGFTFKAPQYVDFNMWQEESGDETFFESRPPRPKLIRSKEVIDLTEDDNKTLISGYNAESVVQGERAEGTNSADDSSLFYSPSSTTPGPLKLPAKKVLRRSSSVPNFEIQKKVTDAETALNDLTLTNSPTQLSTCSSSNLCKRGISNERLDQLSRPKSSSCTGQYVGLAEAVKRFHNATPKRFRVHATPPIKMAPLDLHYRPQEPHLRTMQRARPTLALSQVEKEKLEMEQAKKFKIKAHPVSQRVLKGPIKPIVDLKHHHTIVQPFHLTEVKKKVEVTKNVAPNVNKTPTKLSRTEPKPFSFAERDQQLMKKKEEMIKKVLEEEKKAREFHAQPVPNSILKSKNTSMESVGSDGAKSKNGKDNLPTATFKARPPVVLHKKPFSPKKPKNHTVAIEEFHFSTDHRAKAWEDYEKKMKETNAIKEACKQQAFAEMKKREALEVLRIRKEAEHKAQPVRKYKPVEIQKANKVTLPVSPVFQTDLLRNKENEPN